MKKSSLLFLSFIVLIIATVSAHEYVLLASKFRVQKGDTLELHLFVADGFNVELERPLQKKIISKYELITQQETYDLLSENKEASLPVLERKVDFEGLGLIHMERGYANITLDNQKFLSYLQEDHIENISLKNSTAKEQRERYTRYIKCLVQSGNTNTDTLYKTVTGQRFEIVLLQNPYGLTTGSRLQAQILFEGKPLANKTVAARNRTSSEAATLQEARTDANGICSFIINRKGDWFIHVTHMIPCPEPAKADWESFWASYSFGVS